MLYTLQIQQTPIEESIRARFAMVIPIIRGMRDTTQRAMVDALGGPDKITFEQLCRQYVESPGDYGVCFEYAVHQSLQQRHAAIYPIVSEVVGDFCGIKGDAESILFGAEKSGNTHILQSVKDSLTDDSHILVGKSGKPPKLKKHIDSLVKAFWSEKHRNRLPESIRGMWKADLFIGSPGPDQWVATTLKTRRQDLVAAPGLRVGLYPEERPGEGPKKDEQKNLIMCPLPYSGEFMQLFGASFQIVRQIVEARGKMPSRVSLVYEDDQTVAKWLVDRGGFPVTDILAALEPLKQPGFLAQQTLNLSDRTIEFTEVAAPIPLQNK